MFTLLTGLPGSSKSLQTIKLVERERIVEAPDGSTSKRPVYYWGIPELKLDWIPLAKPGTTVEEARARYDLGVMESDPIDAHLWHELPSGSIVVMDECHEIFPKRKQGSTEPPHVAALAVHRHKGFDLYGMSQHPQKIDIDARRQVQRHWHLERPFGLDYANALQWERCMSPDDRAARAQANVERMSLDKSVFGLYRSADVHTVKKRLPWKKLGLIAACVASIGFLAWFAGHKLMAKKHAAELAAAGASVESAAGKSVEMPGAQWVVKGMVPRVSAWPWSAPFYDQVAKVESYPRIVGCMKIDYGDHVDCRCSNGQGNAQVSEQMCNDFMLGRVFDPTRPGYDAKAENIQRLNAAGSQSSSSEGGGSGAYVSPPVQNQGAEPRS